MKRIKHEMAKKDMAGRERGVAAVEFALVIALLLLIVAGIFEFGRAFWYYDALAKATRDAARYLSTASPLDSGAESNAKDIVAQAACAAGLPVPGLNKPECEEGEPAFDRDDNVEITVTYLNSVPDYVTVAIIDYNLDIGGIIPFFTPVIPAGGVASYATTLGPRTTMRYIF